MLAVAWEGIMSLRPEAGGNRSTRLLFVELAQSLEDGTYQPARTIEIANKYGVSRATAWRWMQDLQDLYGLVIDCYGRWNRAEQMRESEFSER